MKKHAAIGMERRRWLQAASGWALAAGLPAVQADPTTMKKRYDEIVEGATVQRGRIRIDLPEVADNGHSVPMQVRINTPSGGAADLRRLYFLSSQNPRPMIAAFEFGPGLARPVIGTRVRLNGSQRVTVLAQFSDGSWWDNDTWVEVNEAACSDPTNAEVG